MTDSNGFLAIWSDIAQEHETDYLHWLTREHTAERVGISGFLGVRVFRALAKEVARYFILYQLQESSIVNSAAYLDRLNAPTAWSGRIMPLLSNFIRGGGRVVAEAGLGQGSLICPLAFPATDKERLEGQLESLCELDRIASVRLYEVDDDATTIPTNEKSMRTADKSFALLLIIEGLSEEAMQTGLERLTSTTGVNGQLVLYDQVFALDKPALARRRT